jgi:ABC-type bacteriocin/lantibiotic exporter with double-glycine peptidase domain
VPLVSRLWRPGKLMNQTVAPVAALLLAVAALAAQPPAVWIDVPFVAQPPDGCGAASLSMLMQYWAAQQHQPVPSTANVSVIQRQLYVPRDHGIPASSMQRYLQQHGFRVFTIHGNWSDLDEHIRKGRPLIVALRPQGQSQLHYVVVDGIDDQRNIVTFNDPAQRKLLEQERASFERDWSATHNWLLLAVPASAQ